MGSGAMVRRKDIAVVGVTAAGLAVTARVVLGMLRRSHSGVSSCWVLPRLDCGAWIWGILDWGGRDETIPAFSWLNFSGSGV